MKRVLTILATILLTATATLAQDYRYEIGPALGVSGYLGDANHSNVFSHPGLVAGGVFRYNLNSRWVLKGDLIYAGISGDTKGSDSKYPGGQEYDFSSSLFDIGVQAEFNFLNYGIGPRYKRYKRYTPYMTIGVGAVIGSTKGSTAASMSIPLGVGVKYKIKERLNVGFEFTMRKEFSDKIDGLTDLYGIKHGFAKNTDW
ncbi:MAG: outer membrane beta-barrel protein, partial [Muribaculaceae bacterium]|nr:outer membrane beta-barrel protein [Muribaculaceae bacterium]